MEYQDMDSMEMEPLDLLGMLRRNLVVLLVLPVFMAVAAGLASLFLPPEYTSTTTMYVLAGKNEGEAQAVTQADLSVGQMLTNDVSAILQSDRVRRDVAEEMGLPSLGGYKLSVTSSGGTRVISLAVTGADPQVAADVANALVGHTSQVASTIMRIESVNVIDEAKPAAGPSGPNRLRYTLLGFAGGLAAAVFIALVREATDTRVRSGSEVEGLLGVPVVGHFPAVERS